jgi:carbon-monoxide dehydrogenase small subunit
MATVNFVLNHRNVSVSGDLHRRLLDVLRSDFGLHGVKEGCGEGECGACAVLMDHKIVNSCLFPLANAEGKDIVTIEEFAKTPRFAVLRKAFEDEGAVQCGFCTPGMIIAAESLLDANPHPTDEEIIIGLSGNLCRCTGYHMIMAAVKRAMKEGDGLWDRI